MSSVVLILVGLFGSLFPNLSLEAILNFTLRIKLFLIYISLIGELKIILRLGIKYCPTSYSAFIGIEEE
jgi:hypothetical protein